jgi:hypothetical protein
LWYWITAFSIRIHSDGYFGHRTENHPFIRVELNKNYAIVIDQWFVALFDWRYGTVYFIESIIEFSVTGRTSITLMFWRELMVENTDMAIAKLNDQNQVVDYTVAPVL